MSFITKPLGSILGSITGQTQADAAQSAAAQQQAGADSANALLDKQYQQTRTDLQPYRDLGTSNISGLQAAINNPLLTAQFTAPTAAEAAATPGYQFTLDQGLKANQNSASARGLGSSGAALKGASNFATGLADSTYGDTFNRALTTFNTNQTGASNQANRLLGLVNLGENAAAGTASSGAQTAAQQAQNITSGAAAGAAGTVGAANAYGGVLNNALNIGTTLYGINTLGARK